MDLRLAGQHFTNILGFDHGVSLSHIFSVYFTYL